jgi:adenine-specific DNA-methyltransferase
MSQKIDNITHDDATRKNIPTAEYQSIMQKSDLKPLDIEYAYRNKDLDPQLIWRGKCVNSDFLSVLAPPLYIQEKVHPKHLIENIQRDFDEGEEQIDLFSDFNGLPDEDAKTEFYKHDGHWSNRLILGDGLQVMNSLSEREGLRSMVQCIYIDPPYGIKFNSNFQWSTTSRDVKDGKIDHITREPEQVKAFRDTWKDGIHSYLTYLRERLIVARELLHDTGSVFVQIGDENVHRVRALMDEVFGEDNFVTQILFKKTGSMSGNYISGIADTVLWYGKDKSKTKFRRLLIDRSRDSVDSGFPNIELENGECRRLSKKELSGEVPAPNGRRFQTSPIMSAGEAKTPQPFEFQGNVYRPSKGNHWKVSLDKMPIVAKAGRLYLAGKTLTFKKYLDQSPYTPLTNMWTDTMESTYAVERLYVVQTSTKVVERCLLMATDPGDLVLDPTCGSGTTAFVAEKWARRWITIDTSRVALALARARLMGARYDYYLLKDSPEGEKKATELKMESYTERKFTFNVRYGFVYESVPRISTGVIANNGEIEIIYEKYSKKINELLEKINKNSVLSLKEWDLPFNFSVDEYSLVSSDIKKANDLKYEMNIEMETSIKAKAENEDLYDRPYVDKGKTRVSGPFTVESLSPYKSLGVDEKGELINSLGETGEEAGESDAFVEMIIENLKISGVQQVHKEGKIDFDSLGAWPGEYISAEGVYKDSEGKAVRAAIFIGPEFGTVSRPDLVSAAREAADGDFDVLLTIAFSYDAHSSEMSKLGRVNVLKVRMNADLHMSDDLKNTGKGNLFVIFGEPDIEIHDHPKDFISVEIHGVDIFKPASGEVVSDDTSGIACWFIDTNYNEESFFVRDAYFLGAKDPYKNLKKTLKSEISKVAWSSINSNKSRKFKKPRSGRIAVKVINHLGDEVLKVYKVD